MRDSTSQFLAFFGIHWITPVIGFGGAGSYRISLMLLTAIDLASRSHCDPMCLFTRPLSYQHRQSQLLSGATESVAI
ncbi:TPA: hypothetical protein ACQ340_002738 [Yersinia enterocolitica]